MTALYEMGCVRSPVVVFSKFSQDTIVEKIVVQKTCLRFFLMKKYFMAVFKSYPLAPFL